MAKTNAKMPITAQGAGMNANMLQWRAEEFNSSKLFPLVIIGIQYEMKYEVMLGGSFCALHVI